MDVYLWHKADMPTALGDVRFRGKAPPKVDIALSNFAVMHNAAFHCAGNATCPEELRRLRHEDSSLALFDSRVWLL